MDIGAFSEAANRKVTKADATAFFGGGNALSVFSVNVGGGATDAQLAAKSIISSNEAEINRIRGYKVRLTPTDNQQLRKIRGQVIELNEKAKSATATEADLERRVELLAKADKILGKPAADVEADDILATLREKINDVLAPTLTPAIERRVEVLENLKKSLEVQIGRNTGNKRPQLQLQNVVRQIGNLTPPRNVNQLSVSERREYDTLAKLTNKHVGEKLVLDARDSIRVFDLQTTINQMRSQLPPDTSGAPSPADVARAYTRLG